MELRGKDLACERGGRLIFSALDFSLAGGEALVVTGRNGAGKSSLLRLIAGLLRKSGGRLEVTGGTGDATLPEQSHYLGHLDAVKPALSVSENLQFWTSYLGAPRSSIAPALDAVDLAQLADLPAAYLRPAKGGGCPSPGWWPSRVRSGFWMSQLLRSIRRRKTGWPS